MTSIEQTGKSVEEATKLALESLGVAEDDVDVEILEEGAKGFLGLGQAPARVRVTVKDSAVSKVRTQVLEPAPTVPTPEEAPPAPPSEEVLAKAAEISLELLQHILEGIDTEASASVRNAQDGQVVLDIKSDNAAVLIGKHGQTIDALQYLVGVITNKRLPSKVRVIVDAEGYRSRREEALRSQALYLAKKVRETGQEAVLDALMSNERRIIHTTLTGDPDIYTYSEGSEPNRRVVISPRK